MVVDCGLRVSELVHINLDGINLGEGIFWNAAGETRRIKAESVFLILKGTRQNHTEKESIDTRRKLSLLATLLTVGIPIWRRVKEKLGTHLFKPKIS